MTEGIENAFMASQGPHYNVTGCIFPLQIWAVERVPALQQCIISYVPFQFPRIIQYRGWKLPRYKKIHEIIESKDPENEDVLLQAKIIVNLEPTTEELETESVRLARDIFDSTKDEDDEVMEEKSGQGEGEEGGEGEGGEEDSTGDGEGEGAELQLTGESMEDREELEAQRLQLEREREELKLLERTLKEREESIKREREVVLNEVELMLKLKEALRLEKEELNEMEVLKKEREMLLREKEELKKEREELEEGKVELKKQMEAFRIEKIRFWKEDCENQKKESEKEDEDALGVDIREKSLQSIPVYTRRPKRVLKPSVYKCSPFISISAVQTTPSNAANDEKQRKFPTSPIPLQAMIDPLRVISQDELHELES
ncbi:uncharacterized protein LOC131230576 [Magnolia sinica]|uniref:uncharacterized protein LOC131230576 n=1 Tax=Magnolia sinica TaxID=86752 RepID=UPI00265A4F47|nr:uncharacterized protein LOC131230576 [Magnolia sinica]